MTSGSILLPTLPSLLTAPGEPFIHRDLSWLQFNERVLSEARSISNPLLERVKFLAITASNLDEFFMIRFASLNRSIAQASRKDPRVVRKLMRERESILEAVAKFGAKQIEALEMIASELEAQGVQLVFKARRGDTAFALGRKIFDEQILPHLKHPEIYSASILGQIENLQLAVLFPKGSFFKIPRQLPHVFLAANEKDTFVFFLDDLLHSHLGDAFRIEGEPGVVRPTRDGDITIDIEDEDTASIPDIIRSNLSSREKGKPVRLQYLGDLPRKFIQHCISTLKIVPQQLFPAPNTLGLRGLWTVVNQLPEALRTQQGMSYPALAQSIPPPLRDTSRVFDQISRGDLLLHHPYDSFDSYVDWIRAACADPKVELIQQTVYRMDALSPVMDALKTAAKTKKVRVVIELRARFDELNNLQLADELRKAGVEVAFGFHSLKLHAKIAMVVRNEAGGQKIYTHLSTGNYNASTARQYEDLAILTANPEFGADAKLFDAIWDAKVPTGFKQLVPAPTRLHRKLINLIQAETEAARAGRPARIIAKVNALVEESIIGQLYAASQAGVQIDLIVRGACSLVPGVKNLSENIRVISLVDRYLEHSRIYSFGDSNVLYLSSADLMPRNFFKRLELAFPILDPVLKRFIEEVVLPAYLFDTVRAKELSPQGTWKKRTHSSLKGRLKNYPWIAEQKGPLRAQFLFEKLAEKEYEGTPLTHHHENTHPHPPRSQGLLRPTP